MDARHSKLHEHVRPRRTNDERGDDVGEERQRQPFEEPSDRGVRQPGLRRDQRDTEKKDERIDRHGHDEPRCGSHAADVGAEIERVCDDD
jgi:hypothetical protein